MKIELTTPLTKDKLKTLHAGDRVFITGEIYTGRDAAHKRMIETLSDGNALPFEIANQTIYYAGPCPAKPGQVIGSVGPTTSGRVDSYTPTLLDLGLSAMIGKGQRSREVVDSMIKNGAVYFVAIGGAGALIAKSVEAQEIIAYDDLGCEAIRKLNINRFPAIVAIDSMGNSLY